MTEPHLSNPSSSCRIIGLGRSICGENGVGGLVLDHHPLIELLRENGVRNPFDGKPITLDWAERHLGSGNISVGHLEPIMKSFSDLVPFESRSATEWDLIDRAVSSAMESSGIDYDDIDAILHISPTSSLPRTAVANTGFNDELREFHFRYKLRNTCRIYKFDNGCSGFLPVLTVARGLLACPDINRILLVSSVWGGDYRDIPHKARSNDIKIWITGLLFGDGAAAAVLTSDASSPAEGRPALELVDQYQRTSADLWVATVNSDPYGDYITINPVAAKSMFVHKFFNVAEMMGVNFRKLGAVAMHQPNSAVVQQVNAKLAGKIRRPVVDIAKQYGNLVNVSALFNLGVVFDSVANFADGDEMFVFTLGADCGMTYCGLRLRVCI